MKTSPPPAAARAARRFPVLLVLLAAFAAMLAPRALAVSLIREPSVEATATNAVVQWSTDVPTGSRVQFGTAAGKLDRRAEGNVDANHRVVLRGLNPGTEYWYTVGTVRIPLATNRFSTPSAAPVLSPGAPDPAQAPPTRATWGNPRSLQDHFDRHGADAGARDADDYAAKAWRFLRVARGGKLKAKIEADGTLRVFDPATRMFAAYNKDGTTKTFFKAARRGYFDDQPGEPATLRQLQEFPLPQ